MKFYEFNKCDCYSLICANSLGEAVSYFTYHNDRVLVEKEMPIEVSKEVAIKTLYIQLKRTMDITENVILKQVNELISKRKTFSLILSKDLD